MTEASFTSPETVFMLLTNISAFNWFVISLTDVFSRSYFYSSVNSGVGVCTNSPLRKFCKFSDITNLTFGTATLASWSI